MALVRLTSVLTRRLAAALLFVALLVALVPSVVAHAQDVDDTGKTVRVGWYESPFNTRDKSGHRDGYAYEYQQKVAAYTGWKYEYVEGSWPDLLQMLIDGDLDLLSDVSFTPERAKQMLFASEPMGVEEYYLFIAPDNSDFTPGDFEYFDGKRVGVDRGSVQGGIFREWEADHGIEAELVEVSCPEEEAFQMLRRGEFDAFVTLDAYGGADVGVPVFKIGSSDFFFAVSQSRPDLLEELDSAMSRIQDENRFYNTQMLRKYVSTSGANSFLSPAEKEWLDGHGPVRVGYQDDYLAFCGTDKKTGELTGALRDYLDAASKCFENACLNFDAVAYPTAEATYEALASGEVDCVFPCNLSTSDGEELGLMMTPSIMRTEVYAIVRRDGRENLVPQEELTIAAVEGDPNYEAIMRGSLSDWDVASFPSTEACLKAVSEGRADCFLVGSYRYNSLSRLCERYRLTQLATNGIIDFSFAVSRGHKELYSILTRTTNLVSDTAVDSALAYYSADDARVTVGDFIRDNPLVVIAVGAVMAAMAATLVFQRRLIVERRRADESQRQVADLSTRVFVDAMTHVRNKGAFDGYLREVQERIDAGGAPGVAVGIFDCNDLKLVNDRCGHDKGDEYLKAACSLLCHVFEHSPVFRIGGDEFAVVLTGDDYRSREVLLRRFEQAQAEANAAAGHEWERVSVAAGVAVYDPGVDRGIEDTMRRADQLMYENKRMIKEAR